MQEEFGLGIYIQKTVGGYFASAAPPQVEGDWRTPNSYSREEVTANLVRLGAHQSDIDDAFEAAEQEWQSAEHQRIIR